MTSILQRLKSREKLWADLGLLSAQTEIKAVKRSIKILLHSPEVCFAPALPTSPGRRGPGGGSCEESPTDALQQQNLSPLYLARVNMPLAVLSLRAFERWC